MEERYILARGGFVYFDWAEEVRSVQPLYENTLVTLKDGLRYILEGRRYGV